MYIYIQLLQCVAMYSSVFQSYLLRGPLVSVPLPVAARGSVLQCIAVCCSVLQCVATRCNRFLFHNSEHVSASQKRRATSSFVMRCSLSQCVAVCCSVLQCVAVCCSVLQCVAVCCSVLQYVVVEQCLSWWALRFDCFSSQFFFSLSHTKQTC